MASLVGSVLKKIEREKKLNILCSPTHEMWESMLSLTGHQFYAFRCAGIKNWDKRYRKLPDNYRLLGKVCPFCYSEPDQHNLNINTTQCFCNRCGNELFSSESYGFGQLPREIEFDIVLSQNKFGQFQYLSHIARKFKLPLISVEHTLPVPSWPKKQLLEIKKMRGDVNIFITEYSRDKWLWSEEEAQVIRHGIDTELFKPNPNIQKQKYILSVVNELRQRNWCCGYDIWERVTQGLPRLHIGSDSSGQNFSKPASSVQELIEKYNECGVFINTSTESPVPMVVLESMSCGAIVVSTSNALLPTFIKHGENGFLTNNEEEMRKILVDVLENQDRYSYIRENARKTILEQFSIENNLKKWNDIFTKLT